MVECFTRANRCDERMDVTQEVVLIAGDRHDLGLHNYKLHLTLLGKGEVCSRLILYEQITGYWRSTTGVVRKLDLSCMESGLA